MPSKLIRFQALLMIITAFFVLIGANAFAASQLVAQGYAGSSTLQPGMIVQLGSKGANTVSVLSLNNISKMLGVVISASDSALTISQSTSSQEVYVSNTGEHNVLVTTQNGSISTGDYITISSISGLGMKADSNERVILGQAAGSFDGTHNVLSSSVLKTSSGQKKTVSIGMIPVDINIASNPLAKNGVKGVPTFLSNLTKFATNKSVSASRIYLGMLCVVAGLIIATSIIYSGIKNGFISIGRNPLAKKVIAVNILKVVLISLSIFAISLGAAYIIITQ